MRELNFFNKIDHAIKNYRRGLITEEEMYKTQNEAVKDLQSNIINLIYTTYYKKIDEYVFQSHMHGISEDEYIERTKTEYKNMLSVLEAIGLITPKEHADFNNDFKKHIDAKVYGKTNN